MDNMCIICFLFRIIYKKVMNRREKYLSLFYELETEVIISSIQKCEYFLINYLHNSKMNQFYSSTSDNSKEGNKEDENT